MVLVIVGVCCAVLPRLCFRYVEKNSRINFVFIEKGRQMIRLLIADDHVIVREGLKQLLSLHRDIIIAGEAGSGHEVMMLLRQGGFDVLMLDLSMSGGGVDLISQVRFYDPNIPILVLSMHNDPQVVRRVLAAGASGYLSKDGDLEMLIVAIRKLSAGGHYIAPSLAEGLAFAASGHSGEVPHEALSEREFHIMSLLVRGHSVNDIADELFISNKTVSTHKTRLMRKMHMGSNAELVQYAVMQGLVGGGVFL
jgi:DNA-binding NarL/FixJ family response regulator